LSLAPLVLLSGAAAGAILWIGRTDRARSSSQVRVTN
jgi:hypothetical protein